MSLIPSTSRSLSRSLNSTIRSRTFTSSVSRRSINSSSSSSSSSPFSSRTLQYATLSIATFGLASTLLSSNSSKSIALDDSSSSSSPSKRGSYKERMAAQHKQAPVPSFAREKAEELEEMEEEGVEDDAQSAFDPSTGQINWDCPCLGGMADGPCGPQFKEAFSCFVFSEAEPKGIECVDKFKAMQDCFREYPEIYKEEIEDEERGLEEEKEMELSDLEKEGGEKKKKDE